jgi:xanthosine utilization system XapX-like protein
MQYPQKLIYLIWVRKNAPSGLEIVDLRGVDTSKELVETHKMVIMRDEPDATGVWIEERVTNHLYGQRDVRLAFRMGNHSNMWKNDSD